MFAAYYRARVAGQKNRAQSSAAATPPQHTKKKRKAPREDGGDVEAKKPKIENSQNICDASAQGHSHRRSPRRAAACKVVSYCEDFHGIDEFEAEESDVDMESKAKITRYASVKTEDFSEDEDYDDSVKSMPNAKRLTRVKIEDLPDKQSFEREDSTSTSTRSATAKSSAKKRKDPPEAGIHKASKYEVVVGKNSAHYNAYDDSSLPTPEWKIGSYVSKTKRHPVFISPTRKIPFKRRDDAFLFESLRRRLGTDEIASWEEYTRIKSSGPDKKERYKGRQVINGTKYDAPGTLRTYEYQHELEDAGWQQKPIGTSGGTIRRFWLSPVYKIEFRGKKPAQVFHALLQKLGGNEDKAWKRYVKIKQQEQKPGRDLVLEVTGGLKGLDIAKNKVHSEEDAEGDEEESEPKDATRFKKGEKPSPEWQIGSITVSCNGGTRNKRTYISPTRKIEFYKRMDANLFESIRRRLDADEIEAWNEYSRLKSESRESRNVIKSKQYDPSDKLNPLYETQYVLVEAGWKRFGPVKQKSSPHRFHWLTPILGIEFTFSKAANEFEAIRKQCNGDECKAWKKYVQKKRKEAKSGKRVWVKGGLKAVTNALKCAKSV